MAKFGGITTPGAGFAPVGMTKLGGGKAAKGGGPKGKLPSKKISGGVSGVRSTPPGKGLAQRSVGKIDVKAGNNVKSNALTPIKPCTKGGLAK
jgi:hypothetical protein